MNTETLEQHIQSGNVPGLTAMLDADASLAKTVTSQQVSALMLACYYRKKDVVNLLLNYLKDDITLFEAAAAGSYDIATYLIYTKPEMINEFSNDGFTPLGLACYFGHPEIARFLVSKGAEINKPSKNGFKVYPLHSAAAASQGKIVEMLIENGADVNVKQQSGATALHSAAQNGNLEILIMLLESGADVNIRMEGGKLPFNLAMEKGFTDIAEILGS